MSFNLQDLDAIRAFSREKVEIVANTPEKLLEIISRGVRVEKTADSSAASLFGIPIFFSPIFPVGMGAIVSRTNGTLPVVVKVLDFREENEL